MCVLLIRMIAQPQQVILMSDMKKADEVTAIALLQNLSFHLFKFM
ncbi:MAG: hypothetical protein V7K72_28880 [Nostoc sp.]